MHGLLQTPLSGLVSLALGDLRAPLRSRPGPLPLCSGLLASCEPLRIRRSGRSPRSVLLVDDVLMTGATLSACGGAARVRVDPDRRGHLRAAVVKSCRPGRAGVASAQTQKGGRYSD